MRKPYRIAHLLFTWSAVIYWSLKSIIVDYWGKFTNKKKLDKINKFVYTMCMIYAHTA